MQLLAKFKQILYMGFRATLNFRKFKMALQSCEPKSLDVALKITGVEKYPRKTCSYGQPRAHLIRVLKGA